MKSSSNYKWVQSGVIFLSSLYLFLLGAASFCMFVHADASTESAGTEKHHSQQTTNHSTLCIWACQVGTHSSSGQISSPPETNPAFMVMALVFNFQTIILEHDGTTTHSRDPPPSFLFA